MTVTLNGSPSEVTEGIKLVDLLHERGLHPSSVLVEHNGVALHRSELENVVLREGDVLEVLRVTAGG